MSGSRERQVRKMGSFQDIPLLLTVRQVSELTGMHVVTIRRGIKDKKIPADKINGTWFISRDAILPHAREVAEHGSKDEQ